MFQNNIYKLFNNDLKNLNNNQLQIHWNTIGKNENRISNISHFFKKYPDCYPKPELPEACGEIKETETTIVKERSFEDTMTIKEVEVIVQEKSKTETITQEAMERELAELKKQLAEKAGPVVAPVVAPLVTENEEAENEEAGRVDNTSKILELQTLLQKLNQLKNKL